MSKYNYKKEDFVGFFQKYFLNGKIEAALIEVSDKTLQTVFKNLSGDLRGMITRENFELPDCQIGFYTTGRFLKLASILNEDISIKLEYNDSKDQVTQVILDDAKGMKVFYAAAEPDPQLLNHDGKKTNVKDYEATVNLNVELIQNILKANSALYQNTNMTFITRKDNLYLILGDINSNSNKIELQIMTEELNPGFPEEITFAAEHVKDILSVNNNRFDSATMQISKKGLLKLHFLEGDLQSEYWLLEKES